MNNTPELTQAMTLILIVLSTGVRHGYAIMMDIDSLTEGTYQVSAGTLYRSIARMQDQDLIEEVPDLVNPLDDDERRRHYQITKHGRQAVTAELLRIETLLQVGRAQLGLVAIDE